MISDVRQQHVMPGDVRHSCETAESIVQNSSQGFLLFLPAPLKCCWIGHQVLKIPGLARGSVLGRHTSSACTGKIRWRFSLWREQGVKSWLQSDWSHLVALEQDFQGSPGSCDCYGNFMFGFESGGFMALVTLPGWEGRSAMHTYLNHLVLPVLVLQVGTALECRYVIAWLNVYLHPRM